MKTAPWILALLAVTFLAQWFVPASIIWRFESALRDGKLFKFQTRPVDPYDAFRGRYVALGFSQENVPWKYTAVPLKRGENMYALIENDTNGFARIKNLSAERPQTGDYIGVKIRYAASPTNVFVQLPFDRYYMNEKKAPAAEDAYRKHSVRGQQDAYVTVRVRAGRAVIEDLYIAGKPIREFLKK